MQTGIGKRRAGRACWTRGWRGGGEAEGGCLGALLWYLRNRGTRAHRRFITKMPDSSDDEHDEAFNAAAADRAKAAGNKAFTEGNFKPAVKHLGIGIKLDAEQPRAFLNRRRARCRRATAGRADGRQQVH